METKDNLKTVFGLFRNYGWKKNLLYIVIGFAVCALLDQLTNIIAGVRVISQFDPAVAVMPLMGFLMGIWGVLGSLLEYAGSFLFFMTRAGVRDLGGYVPLIAVEFAAIIINCALPAMLWYAIPLKGQNHATYPRLETCAAVVKYYVIMIVTVALYVIVSALSIPETFFHTSILTWAVIFTRNLDVVLIAGMPIIIIISVIKRRTININERMVLAFLFICVIASVIGAFLVYRTTLHTQPELFSDYETIMSSMDSESELSAAQLAAIERYDAFWNWYYIIIAVLLNVLLIIEFLFMHSIEKKITRPILHLAGVLEDYTENEDEELHTKQVIEDCRPYRYGYGEVSSLTRTCVDMVTDIENRTERLKSVTAEKERIGTELDVASKIQRDMLPSIFPPFPDRSEIDLYASMTPAREVGGDFYDFYLIDHNHLALAIADVSGKGVPASLFMVISKTLLQNHAQMGGSPKEILSYVNHQLCQNNDSFMFCTVWLGILDLSTGRLVAANAGHEYPAIRRHDGSFELMKDKHDPPLGIRDGLRYHEYELMLEKGDILFQYTDGVTEATDSAEELFGEERMTAALNSGSSEDAQEIIEGLYGSINDFVKDAPQFDDITMLCLRYLGAGQESEDETKSITVPARVDCLEKVNEFAEEQLEAVGCDMNIQMKIMLAVEEIFVNIANYAFEGREEEGEARIIFSFDEGSQMAQLEFHDRGIPYDPTGRPDPDITLKPDERPIGGLGIYIVRKTMDEVKYSFMGGENILTIRKKIV